MKRKYEQALKTIDDLKKPVKISQPQKTTTSKILEDLTIVDSFMKDNIYSFVSHNRNIIPLLFNINPETFKQRYLGLKRRRNQIAHPHVKIGRQRQIERIRQLLKDI